MKKNKFLRVGLSLFVTVFLGFLYLNRNPEQKMAVTKKQKPAIENFFLGQRLPSSSSEATPTLSHQYVNTKEKPKKKVEKINHGSKITQKSKVESNYIEPLSRPVSNYDYNPKTSIRKVLENNPGFQAPIAGSFTSPDATPSDSIETPRETAPPKMDPIGGMETEVIDNSTIAGEVKPLLGLISSNSKSYSSFYAYAAENCSHPKVGLYHTRDLLKVDQAPIYEHELDPSAKFLFKLDESIDRSKPQEYSLQVTGCDVYLARIVTGFTRNQNILLSSTIISYTQVSPFEKKPTEITTSELDKLTKALQKKEDNFHNIVDAYNELKESLSKSFSNAFDGDSPEKLTTSLPIIKEISIPSGFSEGEAALLKVDAEHWYPQYDLAVEWFINGVSKGFGTNWNWIPPANSKANVNIEVRIGMKSSSSNTVDSLIPYHRVTFSRPVENTLLPISPVIATDPLTNSPLLQVRMTTGAFIEDSFDFCSTFSRLAITEIPISPEAEQFNFICSQEFFQDFTYQLSETNQFDGPKTLYLWAKDDQGEISSSPSTVNFILDQTPASIVFDPIASLYGGGNNLTLNWTFNEQNASSSHDFRLEFFNGASWTLVDTVPSYDGVAINEPFSIVHLLPYQNINNARYRITYDDMAGNTTLETSPVFNIRIPELNVSPLSHNFGPVISQTSSAPLTVTFSNIGGWKSAGCGLPVLSGDSSEFAIVTENCSLQSLEAETGSCEVIVMGAPKSKASFNANLTLNCGSLSATMGLSIQGDNNPPTLASPQLKATNEDTPFSFSVQSASDIDADSLTYSIVTAPVHGTLSGCLESNNILNCNYTPSANFFGEDSFTYRAWDGESFSNTALVKITINPVNDPPTLATGPALEVLEDSILSFDLVAGEDIENDTLTYIITSTPAHGNLTCTGGTSRSCIYTPSADYFGTDSFSYKVNDGNLDSNTVTVSINVLPANDPPVSPSNFALTTDEDQVLSFSLQQGTDVDNDQSDLGYTLITAPAHGTLTGCLETANSKTLGCSYLPHLNYYGSDTFSYKTCDTNSCSGNTTTVTITINSVNDLPVMISDQVFELTDNDIVEFDLSGATDIDIPVQTLSYRISSSLADGLLEGCIDQLTWKTAKHCKFTPPTNFNGELSFQYKAFDGEEESQNASTVTFRIQDKTPSPKPVIALHSPSYTNIQTVEVTNTSCTDIDKLYISTDNTTPNSSDSLWVSCTTSPGALTASLSAVEGVQNVFVWSMDEYSNVNPNPAEVSVVYDVTAPLISILARNIESNKNAEIQFTLTEKNSSSSLPFQIEYFNGTGWSSWTESAQNGPLTNKVFSTIVSAPNSHGTGLTLKVSYTDLAGNTQTAEASFLADQTPPALSLFELNNNQTVTVNNNVLVKLEASDDLSSITSFCLKYNDDAKPALNADCWREVNATPPGVAPDVSISFHNYYFQIGFVKSTYSVYAWVKDQSGQISNNSGLLGIDKFDIYFDPGTPPRITNIEATNSNTPNSPVNGSDLIAGINSDIFVRWYAEDDEGMQEKPISVEYTLDDKNFQAFPNGQGDGLLNGVNGTCSFGPEFTGCAVLKAPTSNYFRVRVIAKDSVETTVFVNPAPFNDSKLTILAGNTEHGLNGSATTAIFYAYGSTKTNSYTYKYTIVMSDDGKFFYLDRLRGLLWVDPQTGALSEFIKKTGTGSGENVHISSATLRNALAIVLDAKNNLLIWDTDSIREVNLSTYKIRTLFGKGTQPAPTTKIAASNFRLSTAPNKRFEALIPLPNGDLIFSSTYASLTHYRYKAATQEIEPITLTGHGVSGYENDSWSSLSTAEFAIAFNPTNSAIEFMAKSFVKSFTGDSFPIFAKFDPNSGNATTPYQTLPPHNLAAMSRGNTMTGMDGKLYFVDRFRRNIFQYNHETNTLKNILGTGGTASSPCPEETPATSCPVDIDAYFVNKTGRIYFIDNGVVRTIDDSKRVITLFGQFPSYGNGSLASLARFGDIVDISFDKHEGNFDKLIIQDGLSNEFRNFTINSTMNNLADYSFSSTGPYRFEVESSTGDFYTSTSTSLRKFSRSSGSWSTVVGGGSTNYFDSAADGKTGTQISLYTAYPRTITGLEDNKLLYYKYSWNGSVRFACMTKIYDTLDSFKQSHFNGDGNCDVVVTENSPLANQTFETSNIKLFTDPVSGSQKYFFTRLGANRMYKATPTGNLEHFATLAHGIRSFTYRDTSGLQFFYCSGGKLYQYDYGTDVTTHLAWNSPTITCKINYQQTPLYVPTRNSVIFVFSQNGLDGVAEYKLP